MKKQDLIRQLKALTNYHHAKKEFAFLKDISPEWDITILSCGLMISVNSRNKLYFLAENIPMVDLLVADYIICKEMEKIS